MNLVENLKAETRELIDVVDQCNALGLQNIDIPTPRMVVVGDQSSGKSSTLENLSGIELPKGVGTVTRAPLELQLRASDDGSTKIELWVNANSDEGNLLRECPTPASKLKIKSKDGVSDAIAKVTKMLVGDAENDRFSKHVIVLNIVAPDVPDLTLIDLPGIIRVGDENRKNQVNEMIENYVRKEDVTVLCVVPCTADIETSGPLELVGRLKAEKRSIVALTKVDQVDRGAEKPWMKFVNLGFEKCPGICGYFLIKNRCQEEIDENQPLSASHTEQTKFFKTHKHWKTVSDKKCGIGALASALGKMQRENIAAALPMIQTEMLEKLEDVREELALFGEDIKDSDAPATLVRILDKISNSIEKLKDEKIWPKLHILFEKLRETIHKTQNKLKTGEYKNELTEACVSHRRRELPLFPSYTLAQQKIGEFLETWRETMQECLNDCAELMFDELSCLLEEIQRFPQLHEILSSKIMEIIEKRKLEALETLDDHLNSSKETPYTQNDYYESTVAGLLGEAFMSLVPKMRNETGEMVRNQFQTSIVQGFKDGTFQVTQIHALILGYWKVCYKEFADFTPKTLLSLLGKVEKDLKLEVRMFDLSNAKEMLREIPEIEEKRAELKTQKKCLEECLKLLKKFNVPPIMGRVAADIKSSSPIIKIRVRKSEVFALKEKIETLEKENEKQRKEAEKTEMLRVKAINEKLNLEKNVENLQTENQKLEEIRLLTAENTELLEMKKENYLKCVDEVKEHAMYFVTSNLIHLKKTWVEAELGPVDDSDFQLYLGREVKALEVEDDDDTVKVRFDNYETQWFPATALMRAPEAKKKKNKESRKLPSAMEVSGRVGCNSGMNGIYLHEGEHCERVYYQKKQTTRNHWTIQWNPQGKQWIMNFDGLSTDNRRSANVVDDVEHPLLVSKTWRVWNGTIFEEDSSIRIKKCPLHKAIELEK